MGGVLLINFPPHQYLPSEAFQRLRRWTQTLARVSLPLALRWLQCPLRKAEQGLSTTGFLLVSKPIIFYIFGRRDEEGGPDGEAANRVQDQAAPPLTAVTLIAMRCGPLGLG